MRNYLVLGGFPVMVRVLGLQLYLAKLTQHVVETPLGGLESRAEMRKDALRIPGGTYESDRASASLLR